MALGTYDIQLDQGSDFELTFTWKDRNREAIDLTDWTARMHVRKTISAEDPLIVLTTENDRITIDGLNGKITLSIPSSVTKELPVELPKPGKGNPNAWPYDLELISPGGLVTRFLEGRVIPSPEVTRE